MTRATIRNLILSSLCLLAAAGGFVYMVYHLHAKERLLQTQLGTLNQELAREDSFYKLQHQAEESAADRELLKAHFLGQESESIDVLNWIEETAPKANVFIETKGLQKITEKETQTDWIEASFAISGERADVERFVAVLERLPYLSYVTSLSLNARASDNWEALVTLRVYTLKYDK